MSYNELAEANATYAQRIMKLEQELAEARAEILASVPLSAYIKACEARDKAEAENAALKGAIRKIEQALIPDPADDRDVDISWLRKTIRAAIDAARKP